MFINTQFLYHLHKEIAIRESIEAMFLFTFIFYLFIYFLLLSVCQCQPQTAWCPSHQLLSESGQKGERVETNEDDIFKELNGK